MSRLNRLASILSLLQDLTILLRNDDSSCDGRFLLSHPACCAQGICSRVTPPVRLHYKGSKFHRIVAGQCVQGGDIMCGNGKGNLSAFAGESLPPSVSLTPSVCVCVVCCPLCLDHGQRGCAVSAGQLAFADLSLRPAFMLALFVLA